MTANASLSIITVLALSSGLAAVASAQEKKDDVFGSEVSAQCAHRRVMPPDPRDGCVRNLRSDAQIGSGQGGALVSSSSDGQASGVGPGNAGGPGNGIGPGSGNGQAKGRR